MNKMIKILVALLVSAVVCFADNWSSNSEWNAPKDSVQTVPTEKDSSKSRNGENQVSSCTAACLILV